MANLMNVPVDYQITENAVGIWKRYRDEKTGYFEEFMTYKLVCGMPLLHYTRGRNPETGASKVARGFIAVGRRAVGVIALGQLAVGIVAAGQAAFGVLALGQLALAALVGVGQLATGVVAVGQLAIGVFCVGQIAVGYSVLLAQVDVLASVRKAWLGR